MSDFHGVLPALITPFTEDGSAVDTDSLAAIVERLIGAGVGGLVPGGSLMLFAGAHGAAALLPEPDERIVERFLADLYALYPQTRGVVAGATVRRWELGNVYARPGRARLQPALEGGLGAHHNLHLAGDYFAELGNLEAAARTGLVAAEGVDARIREVSRV